MIQSTGESGKPNMETNSDIKRALIRAAGMVLVGLVFQTGALLWWGGKMEARMSYVERNLDVVWSQLRTLERQR